MNEEETMLDHRDMYFLGVLAERILKDGKFPRGCGKARALALSRAGYLIGTPHRIADRTSKVRFEITANGQPAWKAYRFV